MTAPAIEYVHASVRVPASATAMLMPTCPGGKVYQGLLITASKENQLLLLFDERAPRKLMQALEQAFNEVQNAIEAEARREEQAL